MDISDQMSPERYPIYAALAEKLYRHLQVSKHGPALPPGATVKG